ncbi:MAG: hypothetical protein FVQ81_04640 [Candidatus Glassbacteria bacterium]|nr:hypothetical protein [Candidatus Glassbacteria bacterium]
MESRVFKIGMLVLFLLLNGCGDEPTRPVTDDDGGPPAKPVYTPPEMFPLEVGAKWEYSVIDTDYSWGYEQTAQNTRYGKAFLEVMEVSSQQQGNSYSLSVSFLIDSCRSIYHWGYAPDTTFVQLNIFDTSYVATLVKRDGEIRRLNAIFLQHFLPVIPGENSHVYLDFYNFGYLTAFGYDLPFLRQNNSSYVFYLERHISMGMHTIKAFFNPDSGGLTKLSSASTQGEISGGKHGSHINLLSYTPGIK